MDFNKSALLGLKAELLRKQQEVSNAKASSYVSSKPKVKLKALSDKVNRGVELRSQLDSQLTDAPSDVLIKSREMLEKKAKLYDRLASQSNIENNSSFLVDFESKDKIIAPVEPQQLNSPVSLDDMSDSDSEWVDFVDCLGRTKRCLREDLDEMKEKDAKLKAKVKVDVPVQQIPVQLTPADELTENQTELLSEDMQRELLRQKWEQKEQELLGARDVHYQDLLFDEARQHGVGYYAFSTDEAERMKQQKELKDLHKETEEAQKAAVAAQLQKKKQMKERLRAARRRKRERLGLPDQESNSEEETEEIPEPPPAPEISDPVKLRKEGPIREWDVGKEDPDRVLSQEEWVARKRSERPSEFAPPSTFEPAPRDIPLNKRHKLSSKRERGRKKIREETCLPAGYVEDLHHADGNTLHYGNETRIRHDNIQESLEEIPPPPLPRTRAEIPPPINLDTSRPPPPLKRDIEASVEEGLRFLREQAKKKEQSKSRSEFLI